MLSRRAYFALLLALPLRAGDDTVRGYLRQDPTQPPAIITRDGTVVVLEADDSTVKVLRDKRLKDVDFEARGVSEPPGKFKIDPIHERALFAWQNGKRLVVTYWCDVCAIRTYTPGKCRCCQAEMKLDLRDPNLSDTDLSQ